MTLLTKGHVTLAVCLDRVTLSLHNLIEKGVGLGSSQALAVCAALTQAQCSLSYCVACSYHSGRVSNTVCCTEPPFWNDLWLTGK
jgi:hypothetical protein